MMIASDPTNSTELAHGIDSGKPLSFRDSCWGIRWIVFSLAVLVVLRGMTFIRTEWRFGMPWWAIMITSVIAPELFMLLVPIFTRSPRAPLRFPTLRRCWIEFLIALPVVIVIAATIVGLEYAVTQLAPGKSILPERIVRIAESPNHVAVYCFMIISFTLVPICEEVFFRGFLQNAFRARMPWLPATIVQCLIFGFGHTFGIVHAIGACFIGLILTLVYERRRTLITPVMVHAGANFLSAVALTWAMWTSPGVPILGVRGDAGTSCVVQEVVRESAADRAGIQRGDVIVTFNTERIRDFPHLVETVRRYRPGDLVALSIERDGLPVDLEVVLGCRGE